MWIYCRSSCWLHSRQVFWGKYLSSLTGESQSCFSGIIKLLKDDELLLGAGFAEAFGIPFGSVEYFALLAAGFAGYFSSIMNTPIASAIMTIELFGMYYSLPAGLAAVIGFLVNQEHTLYDLVLEEREEKREEELVDLI